MWTVSYSKVITLFFILKLTFLVISVCRCMLLVTLKYEMMQLLLLFDFITSWMFLFVIESALILFNIMICI